MVLLIGLHEVKAENRKRNSVNRTHRSILGKKIDFSEKYELQEQQYQRVAEILEEQQEEEEKRNGGSRR